MKINNFARLTDARPNFSFEKFQLPDTNFNPKIGIVKPILNTINPSQLSPPVNLIPQIKPVPTFSPGTIATFVVLGSVAIIVVSTIYINQTT